MPAKSGWLFDDGLSTAADNLKNKRINKSLGCLAILFFSCFHHQKAKLLLLLLADLLLQGFFLEFSYLTYSCLYPPAVMESMTI